MNNDETTQNTACEFKASIGKDGQLVIEADSEECQKIAVQAASEKGVDVKHVTPKVVTGETRSQ
ncbi:hypothetical protein ACFLV0_06035 [Chloroflexota bacterium]